MPKSASKARPKGRRWTHELMVVGLGFRLKRDVRRALADTIAKRGSITHMRLEREPDNPADENAIKVLMPERMMHGVHIGYLVRESAALLAPKMDSGSLAVANAILESVDGDDYKEATMNVTFIDVVKPRAKSRR